ncbi:MAG: hypothetical protein RLZ45_1123 [Verrucomicrobiota bacterium]|jgi:carboxyl-terminal processing protease
MYLRALYLLALLPLWIRAADPASPAPSGTADPGTALVSAKYTNSLTLQPKEEFGQVAKTFAWALQRTHYTRNRFDDTISGKFFDRYLEVLDPQRVYFLQSDYDGFAPLRTELDNLTVQYGNVQPAFDIFNRFMERFDQQYAFVTEYLKTNRFTFETDEKFVLDRKDGARPKDLEEARKLWRDRVRSEYLAEKLTVGDREELLSRFRTNVLSGNWDQLTRYLTNKFSPEKSAELTEFAKTQHQEAKQGKGKNSSGKALAEKVVSKVDARLAADTHDEIVKKLMRRYNRTLRNVKQFDADEVIQFYLSALGHAYDPHTDYFGKQQLDSFSINMNLSLFGIGATLQSDDGYTVIRSLVAGAPAEMSKQIKVNDRIVSVAQGDGDFVDVRDEKLSKVVEQIRGPKGTKVRLEIIPAGADLSVRKIVSLVRDEVKLEDSEAKAKLIELTSDGKTNRIGVIDLPSFYANFPVGGRRGSGKTTTGDVSRLVKKLVSEGAQGIVLDLRRNGGGSLEEAINLTGLFIKAGPVVQVRNFDGRVNVDSSSEDQAAYDGPMVVLTSRFSASASEILAGALQDHDRAVIVGDSSTHGKGTVQTVQELGSLLNGLKDAGAAKVTIRKFYRPNGSSTQLKGVVPDIILPSVENHMDVGESSLENALSWDTIESSKFSKDGEISRVVTDLRKRSEERVARDRDFDYVREDSERYRKIKEDKMVSLNEAVRRKEISENKARAEARKKEQADRKSSLPTMWEITLKVADQPGLPPAMTNSASLSKNAGRAAEEEVAKAADAGPAGDEDDADAPAPTPVDPQLNEAERILLDLIRLNPRRTMSVKKD